MEAEYNFSQGKQGTIDPIASGKTRITIHLNNDVLAWFRDRLHRSGGGNYQTLINEVFRQHVQHQHESIEETFQRVLREELGRVDEGKSTRI
ncbi:MAG: BrnA antitoxin family protein [Spirulina sp.]